MERQRIPLYKIRQFGEKINDTFSFVSENFKPLFKYVTYFMLPLALLMALAMNGYMDGVLQTARNPDAMSAGVIANFAVGYGGIILLSLLMGIILPALIYAMMRIYSERENGLKNLTWQELKPTMMHLLKRNTKLMLAFLFFGLLLFAVFGVLVALSVAISTKVVTLGILFIIVLIVGMVVITVPFSLASPIYLFEEDMTFIGALKKAFRLGMRTWWGIFGVTLVLYIIIGIVSGVISMPWYIATMAKTFFGLEGEGAEDSFVNGTMFSFITYLLGVVQAWVGYLCYSVPVIGMAYQYGHASEKVDHVTVATDIEQFETL